LNLLDIRVFKIFGKFIARLTNSSNEIVWFISRVNPIRTNQIFRRIWFTGDDQNNAFWTCLCEYLSPCFQHSKRAFFIKYVCYYFYYLLVKRWSSFLLETPPYDFNLNRWLQTIQSITKYRAPTYTGRMVTLLIEANNTGRAFNIPQLLLS